MESNKPERTPPKSALDGLDQSTISREQHAKRMAIEAMHKLGLPLRNPDGSPSDILRGYIEQFAWDLALGRPKETD